MLGILCGLESEARIARRVSGAVVACAAARPHKARDLARSLVQSGATRLLSFGIAGALDPSVRLGDLVIGTRVVSPAGAWMCDPAWGEKLASTLPFAQRGGVYGSETLVPTGIEKIALGQSTACAIVDMESQCAAEVAAEAGIPLMVLRAVCDGAGMNVPPVVMAAIAEDGTIHVRKATAHLLRHPAQWSDLFSVLCGTGKALGTLKKASPALRGS